MVQVQSCPRGTQFIVFSTVIHLFLRSGTVWIEQVLFKRRNLFVSVTWSGTSQLREPCCCLLLVIGGTGMAFHYKLLNETTGGDPPTLAVGDPVSGKSTVVDAASSVFDQTVCAGGKWFKMS